MNHEAFIKQCIESIVNQTYTHIEIVYLDNASSDKTFEIGSQLVKESGLPYKIFKNESSEGISKNLNFLFKQSSGEFIVSLSADDWLTKNSFQEKVDYFRKYSEFGMVYSKKYIHNLETNEITKETTLKDYKEGWVFKEIIKKNFISTTGAMIRESVFDIVGGFDENSPIEDWDMWIRIAERFPIGFINKELAYYGIKGTSNISENIDYMNKGYRYILKKYSKHEEIKEAKKYITEINVYYLASQKPSIESLLLILKNFNFNSFYMKQLIKVCIGIIKKKFT